ncbi:MAG: hypothetical protein GY869_26345 [Planctomycetes bacterium]|nr:hypothetical protein [Planctomycetota bacterium]
MAGLHDVEPTYLFEDRRIMEQYTVGNVRNMVMINCPINGDEVVAFELGKQGGGIPE